MLSLLESVLPASFQVLSNYFNNIDPRIAFPSWTTSLILTSTLHRAFQCMVHSRCFKNVCGTDERLRSRFFTLSQLMRPVKNCNKTRHENPHCAGSTPRTWNPTWPLLVGNLICIEKILPGCELWWIAGGKERSKAFLVKSNTFLRMTISKFCLWQWVNKQEYYMTISMLLYAERRLDPGNWLYRLS